MMKKTVFLFSGQGSQYPKMAEELLASSEKAAAVFACASEILEFDLKEMCLNGAESDLAKTEVAQPAIMATSLAALCCMQEHGITASAVAGHSLGEYAAMVTCGMLSMADGFRLIKLRAAAMGKCAAHQDGSMAAIIGLPAEEVAEICKKTNGYVVPVNYNSTMQTVIAGEKCAVAAASETVASMGKRAIPLAVSAAFHSKLMKPAADEFLEAAKGFSFVPPKMDFYSNLLGGKMKNFSDMPHYLASHIISPVKFTAELTALQEAGITRYVELGPGKVLTGLVKKTLKDVIAVNVENTQTFEKAVNALSE
ncbi:MAG: ACP S-malonyltransferase [Oscillospiraceae bacterium]